MQIERRQRVGKRRNREIRESRRKNDYRMKNRIKQGRNKRRGNGKEIRDDKKQQQQQSVSKEEIMTGRSLVIKISRQLEKCYDEAL